MQVKRQLGAKYRHKCGATAEYWKRYDRHGARSVLSYKSDDTGKLRQCLLFSIEHLSSSSSLAVLQSCTEKHRRFALLRQSRQISYLKWIGDRGIAQWGGARKLHYNILDPIVFEAGGQNRSKKECRWELYVPRELSRWSSGKLTGTWSRRAHEYERLISKEVPFYSYELFQHVGR